MESSPQNINKENYLPKILSHSSLYFLIAIIIFFIIMMLLIFFDVNLFSFGKRAKSNEELIKGILATLFFSLLIVGLSIMFLPNLKDLKNFMSQISNVVYVIMFTVFSILFYSLIPNDILDKYSYIFTPLFIGVGALVFYMSSKQNYVDNFNISYERIKMLIILFCLITFIIIFYNVNPGGVTDKYFGYSLLITIILSVFAFMYLLILMTIPNDSGNKQSNLLSNFSSLSVYGSISFILFIIVMTILISSDKTKFFNNKAKSSSVMILLLLISVVWSIILSGNLVTGENKPNLNIYKQSLLILFGLIISGLLIFWITYNIQHLSGKSSIVSFILNLFIVILVLGLIYKTIYVKMPSQNDKKNSFFNLLSSIIFYIPCVVSFGFDWFGKLLVGQYNASEAGSLMMLVVIIGLYVVYFLSPSVLNSISKQGGKQLVNKPVSTDTVYNLGTYQDLNSSDNFDYQYAISCWLFIDAVPPNTAPSYNKYTSLLNFGNKPNISYNAKKNKLMITMQQKDLQKTSNNKSFEFDDEGNRIIYIDDNFLLQKWNNVIINYNGGTLDIFINGSLVKSSVEVVPYYTLDSLTIGEMDGINGGICNVIYFNKVLSSANIYYLYNLVKNNNPPVSNESSKTILINNINQTVDSI